MSAAAFERALALLETLRAGRIMVDRLDAIVAESADRDDLETKELGHVQRMSDRSKQLADALQLSPARAAAAVQRVRSDCRRTTNRIERELEAGFDEGPTFEMGLWEADLMVLRIWPAPLGPPPSQCPACGDDIEPGEQRAHTSADVWVCPACLVVG